jgi:CBS domain containing-hemolysin-like protein
MFRNPDRLMMTTLVGTDSATVAFTTTGTVMMVNFFRERGDFYAFLLFTLLLLVLGEIVPKSVYQQKAELVAPVIVYPFKAAFYLFLPIIFLFSQIAHLAIRVAGGGKAAQKCF